MLICDTRPNILCSKINNYFIFKIFLETKPFKAFLEMTQTMNAEDKAKYLEKDEVIMSVAFMPFCFISYCIDKRPSYSGKPYFIKIQNNGFGKNYQGMFNSFLCVVLTN